MAFRPWVLFNGVPTWLDTLTPEQAQEAVVPVDAPRAPQLTEALWNDRHYANLKATDGTPIDSRAKHQRYMKDHNLTTVDDFTETWKQTRKEREDFYTTGGDHRARREAVERAIHEINQRRR